jgi:hypothetical protein
VQIHSVGIDLGKTTFHLVALGAAGKVLVRKVCTGAARTKEQSQRRVRGLVTRMVSKEQPADLEGQTRAQLIMARRTNLQPKAEYICADFSSRPHFPLQSCGGPYISVTRYAGFSKKARQYQTTP